MRNDVRCPTEPQGDYVPAHPQKESDPVGRCGQSDWGFWDETWSHWHGGCADEAEARAKLAEYCSHL